MKNERPSKFTNVGEDVCGAARHRNDTYDNAEQRAKKIAKKEADQWKKARKTQLAEDLATKGDDIAQLRDVVCQYELDLFFHEFTMITKTYDTKELRAQVSTFVRSYTPTIGASIGINYETCRTMVRAYNRLAKKISKIRNYSGWGGNTVEELKNWAGSKQRTVKAFSELCGRKGEWTGTDLPVASNISVRAIQWGNSVTDKERAFVLAELNASIDTLSSLATSTGTEGETSRLKAVIAETAYAFGARGRKGALAHYEYLGKVLNINHGVFGCLVHEIGHAISKGEGIPESVLQAYRQKVMSHPILKINAGYYLDKAEIFARAFERYCANRLNLRPFAILDVGAWPDETEDLVKWVESKLK